MGCGSARMCLKGCSILVLPCTILVVLIAITLGLLIEADRQGVEIPTVTPLGGFAAQTWEREAGRASAINH